MRTGEIGNVICLRYWFRSTAVAKLKLFSKQSFFPLRVRNMLWVTILYENHGIRQVSFDYYWQKYREFKEGGNSSGALKGKVAIYLKIWKGHVSMSIVRIWSIFLFGCALIPKFWPLFMGTLHETRDYS